MTTTTGAARWDDVVLTGQDVDRLQVFWGGVLGRPVRLRASEGPKQVKKRVHLDVHAASVADLEGLGATVLAHEDDTGLEWTVMADPEGGELCAFVSHREPRRGLYAVVVDSVDPESQAAWWAAVLGAAVDASYAPETWTVDQPGGAPPLVFQGVPEPRTGPNRVQWDVVGDVRAVLAAGATHLRDRPSPFSGWQMLADPEGNEFCVFAR